MTPFSVRPNVEVMRIRINSYANLPGVNNMPVQADSNLGL